MKTLLISEKGIQIMNVVGARTQFPNTPISDMERCIPHVVDVVYEDGSTGEVTLYAECPIDAMDKVWQRIDPPINTKVLRRSNV
tara:strand:- start:717 stop:968 length:252 start_codon:yes stop_codon:yes gene_type:complete